MSTNITPAARLTALVLSAPSTPPADDLRPYCALARANAAAGGAHNNLIDFAAELGFTRDDTFGIMNGWDRASGARPVYKSAVGMPECAHGERLGEKLYHLIQAAA